jgi:hypothetical protein
VGLRGCAPEGLDGLRGEKGYAVNLAVAAQSRGMHDHHFALVVRDDRRREVRIVPVRSERLAIRRPLDVREVNALPVDHFEGGESGDLGRLALVELGAFDLIVLEVERDPITLAARLVRGKFAESGRVTDDRTLIRLGLSPGNDQQSGRKILAELGSLQGEKLETFTDQHAGDYAHPAPNPLTVVAMDSGLVQTASTLQ